MPQELPLEPCPAWPTRGQHALAAAAFLAIATYGSLVPFDYRPLPMGQGIASFARTISQWPPPAPASRTDWLANCLLFVPVGYFLLGMLAVGRTWRVRLLAVAPALAMCVLASLAIEFSQVWFPDRTPSLHDVVAQTIGALLGMVGWLTLGDALPAALRRLASDARAPSQLDWIVWLLAILLAIGWLYPIDLTLRPGELVTKYRRGQIVLDPRADWQGATSVLRLGVIGLIFLPLGALAATALTSAARPVRGLLASAAIVAPLLAGLFAAQLLVASRTTSVSDHLAALAGSLAAAWIAGRWLPHSLALTPREREARGTLMYLLLSLAYAGLLMAVFCAPFQWINDHDQIRQRAEMLARVPFSALYAGSPFNALKEILRKSILFVPLGVLLVLAVQGKRQPRPAGWLSAGIAIVAAALAGLAIEVAQVFQPQHYPDSTDILLYAAGAGVGAGIALWLTAKSRNA